MKPESTKATLAAALGIDKHAFLHPDICPAPLPQSRLSVLTLSVLTLSPHLAPYSTNSLQA